MNPHSYRLLELVPHSEFGPSAFYGYSVTSKVGYMTLWGDKIDYYRYSIVCFRGAGAKILNFNPVLSGPGKFE